MSARIMVGFQPLKTSSNDPLLSASAVAVLCGADGPKVRFLGWKRPNTTSQVSDTTLPVLDATRAVGV